MTTCIIGFSSRGQAMLVIDPWLTSAG